MVIDTANGATANPHEGNLEWRHDGAADDEIVTMVTMVMMMMMMMIMMVVVVVVVTTMV